MREACHHRDLHPAQVEAGLALAGSAVNDLVEKGI